MDGLSHNNMQSVAQCCVINRRGNYFRISIQIAITKVNILAQTKYSSVYARIRQQTNGEWWK